MVEVAVTQLIIVNITMEEAKHRAKILALMNIAFPFHKSDKNYPIDFIINPPYWLRGIMLPLCVTNETAAAIYALGCVDLSRREFLFARLLPEDKYLSFTIFAAGRRSCGIFV